MRQLKRLAACVLIVCLMLQMGAEAGNASMMSRITTSGDVKMIFRGMEMKPSADGQSVQGFLEIRLRGIETTGAGFSLRYDTNYLTLSNVSDNQPTSSVQGDGEGEGFFEQNADDFPKGCFLNASYALLGWTQDFASDQQFKTVHMNFVPDVSSLNKGPHYNEDDALFDTTTAGEEGYLIGRLSFQIKDPAGLMQMSASERKNVLQVNRVPVKVMQGNEWTGEYVMKDDVTIGYLNEEKEDAFYDTLDYLDYTLDFTAVLNGVRLDWDNATVLAPDLYQDGTQADLIRYLNRNMREVTVLYTDNSERPSTINWGEADHDFTVTPNYDPKGGDYTVTQRYNDTLTVSAKVHVTPVHVIGYTAEGAENIVYGKDAWPIKGGSLDEMSDLPQNATPVFDNRVTGKAVRGIAQITSWESDLADLNAPNPDEEYTFTGTVDTAALETALPWLTSPSAKEIKVTRWVGGQTGAPEGVTAYATVEDGKLVIHVEKLSGSDPILDGTAFTVRLPNGATVPEAAVSTVLDKDVTPPGTGATVTVDPALASGLQELTQRYINTGGEFSIAAQKPGKGKSGFTDFTSAPRKNIYLGPEAGGTEYVFDYSGAASSLMPMGLNPTLSTLFTLPDGDFVRTSINGSDGSNGGTLNTFRVEQWTLQDADAAKPEQPGQVLTYVGTLATAAYTGFGTVEKPEPAVTVRLLVKTQGSAAAESIQPIDDYYFDKRQTGYEMPDAHQFLAVNVGTSAIAGLSAQLSEFSFAKEGGVVTEPLETPCFALTMRPVRYVESGGSTAFEISTLTGLEPGNYSAKVTLSSDQTDVLAEFQVLFCVTEKNLYTVTVTAQDDEGTGSTVELVAGTLYYEGEDVRIYVKPGIDGKLNEWTTDIEGISNEQFEPVSSYVPPAGTNYSCWQFQMPAQDINVTGVFTAAETARLRLEDLRLTDAAGGTSYALRGTDYQKIAFDPAQLEWNVIVPNDVTQTKLQFKPRNPATDADINFAQNITVSTFEGTFTAGVIQADGYYKPDTAIELKETAPGKCDVLIRRELKGADGQTATLTYTLHLYRALPAEEMVQFNPGNSPYGLIESTGWTEDEKTGARSYFDQYYRFESGRVPEGCDTSVVYRPEAWQSGDQEVPPGTELQSGQFINYDKDPHALFVYQGESFVDPGFGKIVNSIGGEVTSTVSRTVTVQEMLHSYSENTDKDLQSDFKSIKSVAYQLTGAAKNGNADFIVSELSDLRIRPGRYVIQYSFEDCDGTSITVERNLFILSKAGDVNISGAVDGTDARLIQERIGKPLPYDSVADFEGARLYQYRICDVNKDGVVNSIDGNYARVPEAIQECYKSIGQGGEQG